jgi:mRNA-degrading endonuclease RelE of RelBE toxin-antitoxin system
MVRLPEAYRSAVGGAIDELGRSPLAGKPLRGRFADRRSLRVGVYRILYRFDRRSKPVTIETVRHRGEAYRDAR